MPETLAMERDRSPGPGGFLRACGRGFLFAKVTAFLYLVRVAVAPVVGLVAPAAGRRLSSWTVRSWARATCRILGIRLTVQGAAPRPPFLLVANHLGYVDALVLLSQLDCVFVARGDAAGWPLFGALCRVAGTIFLDRRRARQIPPALRQMELALAEGRGVALFPEGTSSAGDDVLPFRPSLLEVASRTGLPVSYASLTYETPPGGPPARQVVCWWGDMSFLPHVARLFSLPGFSATLRYGDRTFRAADRKVLAGRLREAVRSRFQPVAP